MMQVRCLEVVTELKASCMLSYVCYFMKIHGKTPHGGASRNFLYIVRDIFIRIKISPLFENFSTLIWSHSLKSFLIFFLKAKKSPSCESWCWSNHESWQRSNSTHVITGWLGCFINNPSAFIYVCFPLLQITKTIRIRRAWSPHFLRCKLTRHDKIWNTQVKNEVFFNKWELKIILENLQQLIHHTSCLINWIKFLD